jgi:hypothetical protein
MQTIAQGGWEAFQAAGQQMMFDFTGFSNHGKGMIVNGVVAIIIVSCMYMAVLGVSGPPDISLWFKPPS